MKKIALLFIGIYSLQAQAQIPANGLIAHFNLNGINGFNSNVNGIQIIPNVYTSNSRTGGATKPGNAMNRYGETDSSGDFGYTSYQYELVNQNAKLKIKKEISFGGWIMYNGGDNFNVTPIAFGIWGTNNAAYGIQGNVSNGNVHMYVSSNTNNNQTLAKNIASEGSGGIEYFRHYMGTIGSDDTMRFYFQGKLVGKKKFLGDSLLYTPYSNGKFYFSMGAQYTSNGWNGTGFYGSLDDVVIYNRALSEQEIWNMFNSTAKCTNNTATKPGQIIRTTVSGQHVLMVTDTTTWHNDQCEFEWYKNNVYGITTYKYAGNKIGINTNGTYKVKVINLATRCWYWTNEIVVSDLGGTAGAVGFTNNQTQVFPNPSNGIFQITNDKIINRLELKDMNGKLIFNKQPIANNYQLDIVNYPAGIYLLRCFTASGISTTKIVKE